MNIYQHVNLFILNNEPIKRIFLQDAKLTYKNQLHFYTLTVDNQKKKKVKKKFHYNSIKKNKRLRSKFNQAGKRHLDVIKH